ncbi:MAG TPA: FtsX-like permease family protein [Blattabacteriaceae bacterium]|jgi:lipoprotein-releasing system permease protein|nr:FtsX-like permease family protein [Blattabacteriaceae bacterium]
MRFELFVAARYLRAKRRQAVIGVITVISVIGVTAGVASLVIALSINAGFQKDLQDQLLGSQSHINLVRVQNDGIEDWRALMTRLAKEPHVTGVAPAMYGQVMATRAARASGALVKGVIPEYENRVSELLKSIKLGSAAALEPCADTDEACKSGKSIPPIVLGKDLAETIGATVGSTIMIISPQGELSPIGMMPKYQQFKVAGIFRSGFYNYDSAWAFIRLSDAQRLFSLPDTVISVIEFKIDDLYKAEEVGNTLEKAAGPGFVAKNWMDENRALFRALRLERVVTFLTIGLIVFVAALNILISLIMMVMEKTKDVAVLISMGAKRRQIRGIFMFQGVLIGVIGTVAGLVLGYGVAIAGAKYHFIALSAEVYSIDYLPFAPRLIDGVLIAAVALLISFVATLYPSWSAARVLPAEALRYE